MSDRQSKNRDEATKAFFSCIAGRTRSKRDEYCEKIAGECGIPSSSRRNVEAANASHGSGEISAPIARSKRTTTVGKPRRYSSSCNYVENTDSEEVPAAQDCVRQKKRKRRNQSKPPRRVGRRKNGLDMDIEETVIERIDEAEFRSKQISSASKIASKIVHSTRQESNQGLSAANSRKSVDNVSKKPSASLDFSPEDVSYDSDRGVLVQKGNGNEDMEFEEIEIERIEEAEFMNLKRRIMSKIGSSSKEELNEGYSAVTPRKDVGNVSKKASSDDCCESFCPEDAFQCSHHAWPSLFQRGCKGEDMVPEEIVIEKIDEVEFRNQKTHSKTKIRCSVEQGLRAASSSKNVGGTNKNMSSADLSVSFPRRDYCADADADADADLLVQDSIPLPKKGKKNEPTSGGEIKIKLIDEAEFENVKSSNTSKIGSSIRLRYSAANCRKNPDIVKEVSGDSYCGSFSSKDAGRDSDRGHTDRSSSFEEKDDGISSCGAKHEMDLGIAARTRSKMRIMKKPIEVGNVSLDLSLDPDSSSTDSGHDSFHSEDFEVESSDSSHGIELCSSVEACEVQKVSAEKVEDSSKQEGSDMKDASKRRDLNVQNKVSNCKQPSFQKKVFTLRKRQLRNDASGKKMKGGKAQKTCEVHEENAETSRTLGNDVNLEEDSQEKSNSPIFTCSKQSFAQNECDETKEVNGLHSKDQSEAGIMRQKKSASPSNLKDEHGHADDDDIQEKVEATSSGFHDHGETEIKHAADEIKEPTRREQVSSEHYDFCSMLADAVLGKGPMLEPKGSDEEAKQALASETQNILPLKFRFEDEVLKEVEKTEYEKEMEGLFDELDINWALEELGSYNYPEVDQESGNPLAEETQHARCGKGKHVLVLQDDQGLICIFCRHVELAPRYVLPEFVVKTQRDSERKRYCETEELSEFDGLDLESSINNVADFGNSANGTVWSIKPCVRESMYQHQQEGFEFLWKNLAGSINLDDLRSADPGGVGGCIISHAPGTGKTRLTIVFLESYLKWFPNCRPVIVSPASMLLTWEEEFRKWNVEFPFLNLNSLEFIGKENKTGLKPPAMAKHGRKEATLTTRMLKIWSWSMGGSILGISYTMFEKLTGDKKEETGKRKTLDSRKEKIRKILLEMPGLVVLDEGHTPRNQRSNIWNALLKLQTEKRVILSGTPFQNNFCELFNTLRIVRPAIADVLEQEKTFAEMIASRRLSSGRKYKGKHSQSSLTSEAVDRALEKLKISMAPFVHVYKGTILQQSLPGLRDCVVLLKPPALQKSLIERLEGSPSNLEFEFKVALISVHPHLFLHFESTEEQRIGIDMAEVEASRLNPSEGVKTKFILELVRLSVVMKEKVLIFSQYIQPLLLIKEQLEENFKWVDGKQILRMRGKLEQKQRQTLINVFNDPQSEAKIMLASTRCCSEGISLIGASRVVLLDVVWNPSVERQAICRAYRIGQKKLVYTYHLMTSGTTEADKYCRQAEKERLSELVFSSSSNESNEQKHPSLCIEDRILEEMVGHEKLKEMFEKIINQPKDADLVQTFGPTS